MAALLAPFPVWAQGSCPAVDFLNARELVMYSSGLVNAPLVRVIDGDGSFTLFPHAYSPPFRPLGEVPNAHDLFTGCLPLPFKPAPLPVRGRQQGEGSVNTALFPDVGNGTAAGAWVAFGGDAIEVYQLNPDYTFKTRTDYPIGERSGALPGDFNGDGKPDLAVIGYNSSNDDGFVGILLGKGDGTFNQAVKTATGGTFPSSAAAADYNRDGKLDIAVAQSSGIALMLGKGDGTFQTPTTIQEGSGIRVLSSADWNGDQRPDLAGADSFAGEIRVWLGNGHGSFRAPGSVPAGPNPFYISSGDFNKDGRNDLAVSGLLGVSVALGNGDGTFGASRHYQLGHEPRSIVVLDFNRDGNLDIVAGEGFDQVLLPVNDTGFMAVLFGNGDGTFLGAPVYLTASSPSDLALGDFNGDGRLDAVAAGLSASTLLLSDAAGGFAPPRNIEGNGAAATGDFNGDGRLDLALGQGFSSDTAVRVFLGDGRGAFQTPLRFPTRSHVVRMAPGDFNGDGRTDLAAAFAGFSSGDPAGVMILLQGASGTLAAGGELAATGILQDAVASDLNGDGRLDLALVDNGSFGTTEQPGGLLVRLGRGDGSFADAVPYSAGTNPNSVAAGDLNGDARNDLVVTTSGPSFSSDLAVFLARADGTLGAATFIPTDFGPSSVAIGDFNRDGRQDLVVAHCCGETDMTYLLGHGDGVFDSEVHFSGGADPSRVISRELNADGRPDLIVLNATNAAAAGISVLLNISPQFVTVSAASGDPSAAVAPDSIVSSYGANLAPGIEVAQTLPLPETLAGITVKTRDAAGTERNAALYAVFPGQINFLMPAETAPGRVGITIGGATTSQSSFAVVSPVAPGLFTLNSGALAAAQIVRANGNESKLEDVFRIDGGQLVPRPIEFGPAPEQLILLLYGTGIRHRQALSDVQVVIGGIPGAVAYAGPQLGYAGLDQINVSLSRSLQGRGLVDVGLTVEGKKANTVKLEFR